MAEILNNFKDYSTQIVHKINSSYLKHLATLTSLDSIKISRYPFIFQVEGERRGERKFVMF